MSRSQLARRPANFPRMKHRAAGRLAKKQIHQIGDAFEAFKTIGKFLGDYAEACVNGVIAFAEAVKKTFAGAQYQDQYALVPGALLPQADLTPHLAKVNDLANGLARPKENQ